MKTLLAAVLLVSILCLADIYFVNKAHSYVQSNDCFFDEFLQKYKNSGVNFPDRYCEKRTLYQFYDYQLCFSGWSKDTPEEDQVSTFTYHRPRTMLLQFVGSNEIYFHELVYGIDLKVINGDYQVVYENSGCDQ